MINREPRTDDNFIVDIAWCNRQLGRDWKRINGRRFQYWIHKIEIRFIGEYMPMLYVGGNHVAGEVTRGKIRDLMWFLKADFNEVF